MDNKPLISVVIPTYNRERMIARAVRSVLEQTYYNVEVHLVDDGSSDNTRGVLEEFACEPRFNYHFQENRGQSAARNVGISKSQGKYIAFLDSDNYWLPHKLLEQINFLKINPNYDVLYSNGRVIDASGTVLPVRASRRFSGNIIDQLLLNNFVSNNTVLVDRRCFETMGGFDEELRHSEDYDLWLRFATCFRFLYHPVDVACYCVVGDDRLSADEDKVLAANFKILSRFFEKFPHAVTACHRKLVWSKLYRWRARVSRQAGKGEPWHDLFRAIKLAPTDPMNWRTLAKMVIG